MPRPRSFLFDRWPRFASRNPWYVLAGALATVAGIAVLYAVAGGDYKESFNLPGTESQRLIDLLEERFPQTAGDPAFVVVQASAGMDDPQVHSRMESLQADLSELPDVVGVTSPYLQPDAISSDDSIAFVTVQYSKQSHELTSSSIAALVDLRKEYSEPQFQVEVGGPVGGEADREFSNTSELIGIAAAVVVLLIAFGSVVAMGLPIITALLALGSGLLLVGVGASFLDMPDVTPQLGAMIGLGAGIDYALLIVTRYREGLARNLSVEDAIAQAAATAGRSVLLAGSTVVIALLGLWAVGIPLLSNMATATALVVALSVVVAIVVLPAILRLAGTRIDRWRIPLLSASPDESETGFGYQLSRFTQRAPLVGLAVALSLLLVLAIPMLHLDLGVSDAGNNPESLTSRRAYDLLSQGFGPGFNGPILVGVRIDNPDAVGAVERLPSTLGQVEGVAAVAPAEFNEARTAATITVIPTTAPQSQETEELVHHLRGVVHQEAKAVGIEAFAGGATAIFIDAGDKIAASMPLFFVAVIGMSFVLFMAVFRSVLVPVKAAVMNLLSVGAAYGVLVAVFQWGWFGSVFGVEKTGPIESFLPIMLFALLFGLSMDYEVFLISRIREEYLKTRNNTEAVARGLSVTARVISAAAAIMVAVFLSFALGPSREIKEFGIGTAAAVFVDATLVRLILVPSLMQLFGDANWWFPRWLDRLVPKIGVDVGAEDSREPVPSVKA
ncbi:MAG TPA: MMPL family transporter [Dehalococcoidia bacterium]|nr:MMPL family transporter [Dehalococcoidia bacterium]